MPRYLIERHFPDGLALPADERGGRMAATVVSNNAQEGVTWLHSYVTTDKKQTFCIYDLARCEFRGMAKIAAPG